MPGQDYQNTPRIVLSNITPLTRTPKLWLCITTLCDWLKILGPLSIRSKTKTNRDVLARVFPCLASATCVCFEL